ncbi:hypothetical protein [Streptomyces sp. ME19-01-6]|uniref:hypothetical protein n=1 Tax=Streptomyces sp. ME19-01-6 TaxID=3028686 RepID=UPI0029A99018|nr:hypothetical protein [Streptomyces sp. ME19-01-6]MDX3229061.1 hypothetical protein [Streptomyces sp. ME19-01-6]
MGRSFAFIAAPLLVTVYAVIRILDGLDGERGPGLAWMTGYLAFLAALLLFVPVFLDLRRLAGGGAFATWTVAAALAGTACTVVQISVDIVIGALAADHDDMRAMFSDVSKVPGMDIVVYTVGPVLFFLGLAVVFCRLAVVRAVSVWRAAPVVTGALILPAGPDLLPVAGALLFAGLAPFARRVARGATAHA